MRKKGRYYKLYCSQNLRNSKPFLERKGSGGTDEIFFKGDSAI